MKFTSFYEKYNFIPYIPKIDTLIKGQTLYYQDSACLGYLGAFEKLNGNVIILKVGRTRKEVVHPNRLFVRASKSRKRARKRSIQTIIENLQEKGSTDD